MRSSLLALAAAAGLALSAASAHATVFTLDHINVSAHSADPGLVVDIDNLITSPLTFDLSVPGANPSTFALFNIYTTEGTINAGEDTVPYPIQVDFDFTSPTPNSTDPATGDTGGFINGFTLFGHFIPTTSGGQLTWDNGGVFDMRFGNGLTGLMTISLNGGAFNQGLGTGTNQGCNLFGKHCNPEAKGLTVYGSFDWVRDPSGGVPEPATWALMIGGLGMAGGMLRRRRALVAA